LVTLDLRGEVCPYTFVKTKLALEELAAGAELRVIIDHEPASRSIPRAATQEGHAHVATERTSDREWQIVIRKRPEAR
jgi:tRNA 2-thiouridine synthesizing protein A